LGCKKKKKKKKKPKKKNLNVCQPSHYMLPNTARDYAAFINRLAEGMRAVGKDLSVCCGTIRFFCFFSLLF
jgi:hypothetical protein